MAFVERSALMIMLFFIVMALLNVSSMAAVYKVGDSAGWTLKVPVDYKKWAASKTFYVGDTIVFEYDPTFHNVMQVNITDYKSCNATAPMATYKTGKDSITIKKHGHYFFLCGVPKHCDAGQKVDIRVVSDAPSPSGSSSPASSPSPSPSPSSPSTPAPAPAPSKSNAPVPSKGLLGNARATEIPTEFATAGTFHGEIHNTLGWDAKYEEMQITLTVGCLSGSKFCRNLLVQSPSLSPSLQSLGGPSQPIHHVRPGQARHGLKKIMPNRGKFTSAVISGQIDKSAAWYGSSKVVMAFVDERGLVLLFFIVMAAAFHVSSVLAVVYKVGDSAGWTSTDNVDYHHWSSAKTFDVGDIIRFEYNPQFHNVIEVNHTDFRTCQLTTPVAAYNSGNDSITIKKRGHYYFICSTPGHCQAGQKVDIRVVPESSRASAPAAPPAPVPSHSNSVSTLPFMDLFGKLTMALVISIGFAYY
ncbi:Plastocyanin-like [Macleaya cordata]|uniref:Plastocyanin-like n=1 Tax=Macleaya cordata TaxID=56857 RepID=A0A200Q508_MACCD|nr:Plastocyanin-like [Macleaya cordata]